MRTKKLILVLIFIFVQIMTTATVAYARPELAQFTLENKSEFTVYVRLTEAKEVRRSAQDIVYPAVPGGAFAYYPVGPKETKTVTVKRALFSYSMVVCGAKTMTGAIDLSNGGNITVPSRCTTYYDTYDELGTLDGVMEPNSLVAFSFKNMTGQKIFYTMTGPQTISFYIEPYGVRSFTGEEGDYEFSYQCPFLGAYAEQTGTITPHFHVTYKITCP